MAVTAGTRAHRLALHIALILCAAAVFCLDVSTAHAQSRNCQTLANTLSSIERSRDFRSLNDSRNDTRRFEREVQATATLSHWNTVEIFDYGRTDDGTFYYVMEYLPGLNLNQIVDMFGPMPAERAIHLLMQTCDALSEAHAKGLVHRDIKPGNIFAANRGGARRPCPSHLCPAPLVR